MIKKIAPKKTVEKLVNKNLTLNRTTLHMLERSGVLSKNKLDLVALKVIKQYKKRFKEELKADDVSKTEALETTLNKKKLMVQRVQNTIITEISNDIKDEYSGERYEWLPSDADTPDPEHQLNYGKRFRIGKGEMPGDRYGCRCGMRILVDEDKLEL